MIRPGRFVALFGVATVAVGGGMTTVAGITDIGRRNGHPQADGGEAAVTFGDQTTNGSAVAVAQASNGSVPFFVAAWTPNDDPEPGTLLGVQQVNETNASDADGTPTTAIPISRRSWPPTRPTSRSWRTRPRRRPKPGRRLRR